jgi:hypothetical protein
MAAKMIKTQELGNSPTTTTLSGAFLFVIVLKM